MQVKTQNLKYEELIQGREKGAISDSYDYSVEMWYLKENTSDAMLIFLKPQTQNPVAAVKFNPAKITFGQLSNKIKNDLLSQLPLNNGEHLEFLSLANALSKHGFTIFQTNKLNWHLQLLDEIFGIRVHVTKRPDGSYLMEKRKSL